MPGRPIAPVTLADKYEEALARRYCTPMPIVFDLWACTCDVGHSAQILFHFYLHSNSHGFYDVFAFLEVAHLGARKVLHPNAKHVNESTKILFWSPRKICLSLLGAAYLKIFLLATWNIRDQGPRFSAAGRALNDLRKIGKLLFLNLIFHLYF